MDIYDEIRAERDYQQSRWGNASDDTRNDPLAWTAYIAKESSRWQAGQFPPFTSNDVEAFRRAMIKTAATAVAAVESLDRQRKRDSRAFYEESPRDVLR